MRALWLLRQAQSWPLKPRGLPRSWAQRLRGMLPVVALGKGKWVHGWRLREQEREREWGRQ